MLATRATARVRPYYTRRGPQSRFMWGRQTDIVGAIPCGRPGKRIHHALCLIFIKYIFCIFGGFLFAFRAFRCASDDDDAFAFDFSLLGDAFQ